MQATMGVMGQMTTTAVPVVSHGSFKSAENAKYSPIYYQMMGFAHLKNWGCAAITSNNPFSWQTSKITRSEREESLADPPRMLTAVH
jgi:hypothetical protein